MANGKVPSKEDKMDNESMDYSEVPEIDHKKDEEPISSMGLSLDSQGLVSQGALKILKDNISTLNHQLKNQNRKDLKDNDGDRDFLIVGKKKNNKIGNVMGIKTRTRAKANVGNSKSFPSRKSARWHRENESK